MQLNENLMQLKYLLQLVHAHILGLDGAGAYARLLRENHLRHRDLRHHGTPPPCSTIDGPARHAA